MIELNKIYNEDCLSGMQRIPDGSVDCIICDLPYEVLHKNNPHALWDRIIPFEPLWEQYERIIKENGAIVLFAQGMFTAKLMMSNQKLWRYNLIWDKQRVTGFLNANRMPMRCHEDICVFYKTLPTYNPQYFKGEPNHPQGNGKHKQTNRCYGKYGNDYKGRTHESVPRVESTVPEGMKLPRSIVPIKKEHESTVLHPTQKPVALIEYLSRPTPTRVKQSSTTAWVAEQLPLPPSAPNDTSSASSCRKSISIWLKRESRTSVDS